MSFFTGPKGRQFIARDVSPGSAATLIFTSPVRDGTDP